MWLSLFAGPTMHASAAMIVIALATSLATGAANAPAGPARPMAIEGKALGSAPHSRDEGRERLDSAVAAVVIGALSEQFDGYDVSITLDSVDVQPASIRDRSVTGAGRLQLDRDEQWIGFSFRTLYDTATGSASYPALVLGAGSEGREVPNDDRLLRQLDANVMQLLGEEFGDQPVRLQLDRVTTMESGQRYLRLQGSGIADFGREGSTPAQVDALYDRRNSRWLRVRYELGNGAHWTAADTDVAG
jgi:hypothetical protein